MDVLSGTPGCTLQQLSDWYLLGGPIVQHGRHVNLQRSLSALPQNPEREPGQSTNLVSSRNRGGQSAPNAFWGLDGIHD